MNTASYYLRVVSYVSVLAPLLTLPIQSEESARAWAAEPAVVARHTKNIDANGNLIHWIANETAKYGPYNFLESKVPAYSLPDPLVFDTGAAVETAKDWKNSRRPQILELFRRHMFGRRPDTKHSVYYEVLEEFPNAFEGTATARDMKATVTVGDRHFSFPFVVFTPNRVKKPVPAIIHIRFGPVSVLKDMEDSVTKCPTIPIDEVWPVKKLIDHGYAAAAFFYQDLDPDPADAPSHLHEGGIRSFFANGQELEEDSWGSISAWGWGASKVLDYLETLESIDNKRIALTGHSRLGCTALWAASEDQRFTLTYSVCSGATGAKLSRRVFGQNIEVCIGDFPHFYSRSFSRFMNQRDTMPFDQHMLIALLAPRAVYVSSAGDDLLSDPKGEYLSVVESAGVFQLLGETCIDNREMPPLDVPRVQGMTGYHIRPGEHGFRDRDWDYFLDYAGMRLK